MGKFLLDLPNDLHKKIKIKAIKDGKEMNDLMVETLKQNIK